MVLCTHRSAWHETTSPKASRNVCGLPALAGMLTVWGRRPVCMWPVCVALSPAERRFPTVWARKMRASGSTNHLSLCSSPPSVPWKTDFAFKSGTPQISASAHATVVQRSAQHYTAPPAPSRRGKHACASDSRSQRTLHWQLHGQNAWTCSAPPLCNCVTCGDLGPCGPVLHAPTSVVGEHHEGFMAWK